MTPLAPADGRATWTTAAGLAFVGHAAVLAMVLFWTSDPEPPVPEPVVLVELASDAGAAPAAQSVAQPEAEREPDPTPLASPTVPTPPVPVPPIHAPLPRDAVILPQPTPQQPSRLAAPAERLASEPAVQPVAMAKSTAGTGSSMAPANPGARGPGDSAKARKQEADYYALVAAHLNRRKSYPTEAKKAREEGIVTVRFTVDREGQVSAVSIKRSSGHALLDQATMDLLRRVAPLPKMPSSMTRESVTLSLPIDYSLRTT